MPAAFQIPGKINVMQVESEVPFGHTLYGWLYINDLQLEKLIKHDQIEKHYLAWESVRKEMNPYFQHGTGFEGYLIGRCAGPEAALEAILTINQNILEAIARLYRFQFNFRSRLMKTLTREVYDPEATHIWSAQLGTELGKLRVQILANRDAQQFRSQTYKIIRNLPPMVYHEVADDVTQTYSIGAIDGKRPKERINLDMLKPDQQDAWLVATNIGEFGHPLVRKLLDHG